MLGDTTVDWREEKSILWEHDLRRVCTSLKVDSLQVGRAIIEDNLRGEVEETGCLWAKLIGNQGE